MTIELIEKVFVENSKIFVENSKVLLHKSFHYGIIYYRIAADVCGLCLRESDASGFLLILATFILFLRRMRMWSMNIQLLEII